MAEFGLEHFTEIVDFYRGLNLIPVSWGENSDLLNAYNEYGKNKDVDALRNLTLEMVKLKDLESIKKLAAFIIQKDLWFLADESIELLEKTRTDITGESLNEQAEKNVLTCGIALIKIRDGLPL